VAVTSNIRFSGLTVTEADETRLPVDRVIRDQASALLLLDGVVGVYEGREGKDETVIRIMVVSEHHKNQLMRVLPCTLGGYRVIADVTGEIIRF